MDFALNFVYVIAVVATSGVHDVDAKTLADSERNIGIAIGIMLAIVVCAVICLKISLKTCCKEKIRVKKVSDVEKAQNKSSGAREKEGSKTRSPEAKNEPSKNIEGPKKRPGNVPADAPNEGEPNPIPLKPSPQPTATKSQEADVSSDGKSSANKTEDGAVNPPPLTKQVPLNEDKAVKPFNQSPSESGSVSNNSSSPTSYRSAVSESRSVSEKSNSQSTNRSSN